MGAEGADTLLTQSAHQKKFCVSFGEAVSEFEDRFTTIGPIRGGRVRVVWTGRLEDAIRVISARWATPAEQRTDRRPMEHPRGPTTSPS